MTFIRAILQSRRALPGAAVISVIALGSGTGVALAQDAAPSSTGESGTTSEQTSTSDPTTSTSEPTTSTSDPTTSSSETTTTSDDLNSGPGGKNSDEYSTTGQTTTTSDALNALAAEPRVATNTTTVTGQTGRTDKGCDEIWASTEEWDLQTVYVLILGTVTIIVTPEDNFNGNWSADAPFTGEIKVKSGQADAWVALPPNSTTGDITSPAGQDISHVEFCGVPGTTTETTTTETTTTDTTTTDTTTDTGGTAGTVQSGGGGGAGGVAGTSQPGGKAGAAATQPGTASGGLPFTGLHVPLMVLIALTMTAAGLALRKRVDGSS